MSWPSLWSMRWQQTWAGHCPCRSRRSWPGSGSARNGGRPSRDERRFWCRSETVLVSAVGSGQCAVERLGLRGAGAGRLSHLGVNLRPHPTGTLVAGGTALAFHHPVALLPGRPVRDSGMSAAQDTVQRRLAQQRAHDHRPDYHRARGGQGRGVCSGLLPPNYPHHGTQPRVTSV